MNHNNQQVVILDNDWYILGYIGILDNKLIGKAVTATANDQIKNILRTVTIPLTAGISHTDEDNSLIKHGTTEIATTDPLALLALAEQLQKQGIGAYSINTRLEPALNLINTLADLEQRKEAFTRMLYLPESEVESVLENLVELKKYKEDLERDTD